MILRPYRYDDVYDMLSWTNDAASVRYLGSGFQNEMSLDDGFDRIEGLTGGDFTGECFVIADAGTDAYLGECNLMLPDKRARKAEISVVLIKGARGQGIAERALRLLIDRAFNEGGYNRLYLKCSARNTPALRLYKKLGFVTEGVLRSDLFAEGSLQDVVLMGLLRNEWNNNGGTDG